MSVLPPAPAIPNKHTLCGRVTDSLTGKIYLALRGDTNQCGILEVNANTPAMVTRWLLHDRHLRGGALLDFPSVVTLWVYGGVLYFTDGKNEPRKVLLTKNNANGSLTGEMIAMANRPPLFVPNASRVAITGAADILSGKAIQVAFRFVYDDGTVSVLSPYSATLAPLATDAASLPAGVRISMNSRDRIENTVREVELYFRYADQKEYHGLLRRWRRNVPADLTAFNGHNTLLATPLSYDWNGTGVSETLDSAAVSSSFDNVPLNAVAGGVVGGRNVLGNLTLGRNTPVIKPTFTGTATPGNVTVGEDTLTVLDAYWIWYRPKDSDIQYWCYAIRKDGTNYLIRGEGYAGIYKSKYRVTATTQGGQPAGMMVPGKPVESGGLFITPLELISETQLYPADNQGEFRFGGGDTTFKPGDPHPGSTHAYRDSRKALVAQATGIELGDGDIHAYQSRFTMQALPAPARKDYRSFEPGGQYNWGIYFKDKLGRKCGVLPMGSFAAPSLNLQQTSSGVIRSSMLSQYTVTVPVLAQSEYAIPAWAYSFSLVRTADTLSERSIHGVAGVIRRAYKSTSGAYNVYLPDDTDQALVGIAINITRLSESGKGYAYTEGDRCDIAATYAGSQVRVSGRVLAVQDGYAVIGELNNQAAALTLCSPIYKDYQPYVTAGLYHAEALSDGSITIPGYQAVRIYSDRLVPTQAVAYRIYTPRVGNADYYDVGLVGRIERDSSSAALPQPGDFIFRGDRFGARRTTPGGSAALPAETSNETATGSKTGDDTSRVAVIDPVGQKKLYSTMVWSGEINAGSLRSGASTFLTTDSMTLDLTTGGINAFVVLEGMAGEGGIALALCDKGTQGLSVKRSTLSIPDGGGDLRALSAAFIGSVEPMGGNGCVSPLSIAVSHDRAYWYDAVNSAVMEWTAGKPKPIQEKENQTLFSAATRAMSYAQKTRIAGGLYRGGRLYMLALPKTGEAALIPSTSTKDRAVAYDKSISGNYVYSYGGERWLGIYHGRMSQADTSPIEGFMSVGESMFSWWAGALWNEFSTEARAYYGGVSDTEPAGIVVSFNEDAAQEKAPLSLSVNSTEKPVQTWLRHYDSGGVHVSGVDAWRGRESEWMAGVLRDRTRGQENTSEAEGAQRGRSGLRLKSKYVQMWIEFKTTAKLRVQSVSMLWKKSSGH